VWPIPLELSIGKAGTQLRLIEDNGHEDFDARSALAGAIIR
jgi:hypothetical protein